MAEPLQQLSTLFFEVPDSDLAADLATRLEDRWACCALGDGEAPVTVVFLSQHGETDFTQLLQHVSAWAHEHGLAEISMRLQGRAFIRAQPG